VWVLVSYIDNRFFLCQDEYDEENEDGDDGGKYWMNLL
jgi:hypothetical protein